MKSIIFAGKEVKLLTQKEKAEELGISVRAFWDHARKGHYNTDIVLIPGTTKKWYIGQNAV
jgi:hypothetical protein